MCKRDKVPHDSSRLDYLSMTNTETAGSNALRGTRLKHFSAAVLILVIVSVQGCDQEILAIKGTKSSKSAEPV